MNPKIELNDDNLNEVHDLETLIVNGTDARVHVEIDVPVYKNGEVEYTKYAAIIKPLPSHVFTNATQIGLKNPSTDVNTEIVKKGLCTKNGDSFPDETVTQLPVGVIVALSEKICEISGIRPNEEDQTKLVKDMMGF